MEKKKGKRILIIEDEKQLSEIMEIILKKEGYEVDAAYDGEEGLRKMRETKPDLVLLDIMLPKLDGRDLLKEAKKDDEIKNIPIVVLSGRAEEWDRRIGLELGAEEYMEKPLEMIKLMSQIRSIARKKGWT